jgi:lipid-A-disaccharide synthase
MAILYKVVWHTYVIYKIVVRVPFLGMPNVLAGREIAREFLQNDCEPEPVAAEMMRLVDDTAARGKIRRELADVIAGLGERGAALRAADAVCGELGIGPA